MKILETFFFQIKFSKKPKKWFLRFFFWKFEKLNLIILLFGGPVLLYLKLCCHGKLGDASNNKICLGGVRLNPDILVIIVYIQIALLA